jgi:hypothetical protein
MKDNCPAIPEYKTHFQAFNIFETTLFVVNLITIVYFDNVEYIEKLARHFRQTVFLSLLVLLYYIGYDHRVSGTLCRFPINR